MRNILIAVFIVVVLGCANNGAPTVPANDLPEGGTASPRVSQEDGRILWGLFDVTLDPVAETAEMVPIRGAALKVNVTQFLQPPAGLPFYLSFKNLDFSDFADQGIVRLEVQVTHPFPGYSIYRGFDVLGIFMADGSWQSDVDPVGRAPRPNGLDARLLNPDGYTRWFNATEFPTENIFGFVPGIYGTPGFAPGATINSYKYFADYLGASEDLATFFQDPDNVDNRGSFAAGKVNSRDYEVYFPDPDAPLKFQYAIIASWEQPSGSGINLDDFPPGANQKEPFLLDIDTSDSTLYYEGPDDKGGSLILDMEMYQWPSETGASIPSRVHAIWVESFYTIESAVDILGDCTVLPAGPVSSVFQVDIASVDPVQAGDDWLLMKVEYEPTQSYDQVPPNPAPDVNLGAYAVAHFTIKTESPFNQAPSVGDITGETNPLEIDTEEYEIAALDPEGDPLHYEWSLVDDGDPVDWGNIGGDQDTLMISWGDHGWGAYDLHCRVKDDYNDWQTAANDPLDIDVEELTITCGTGEFGYFDYAYTQCQQVETAFLSDGKAISEYGYSFTSREFEVMEVWYGWHQPGYCGQTNYEDPCDDTWCELYSDLYFPDTDPSNRTIHMDSDLAGTYGEGEETDDVVAFVMLNQPSIVRFLGDFDNTAESPATQITTKTIPTGNVIAMDFDENGDLWVLDSSGATYELTKSSTYTVGSAEFTVDMDTVAPGSTTVFDWAISYLTDDFFLYTDETVGGTIHKISGNNGAVIDTISNALDAGVSNPSYGLGGARADIEIDHRIFTGENPLAEHCRLVISGGPGGTGSAVMFARYDQELNLLSTWDNNKTGGGSCNNWQSTSGGRFIVFDPVDHDDDPGTIVNEDECDHTMWVGDAGTSAGNMIWADSCRPIPEDWDGW